MNILRPRGVAVIVVAASLLAACGSDGSSQQPSSSPAPSTVSSTSGAPASSSAPAAEASYPITVQHVFGETVIDAKPERIATVAWANHEVPLALGVVPIGMSKATWGDDDDDGVLPWVEDRLTELGAETPVLFDETDGIDFEAIGNTEPDLILAAYSGITQEEYDTLSKIAPVVAYPKVAWGTSVKDMILLSSKAMGMADEGEQLVTELEDEIATTFAEFPQLADKTIVFTYIDPNDTSQIGFYTNHDTRPGFLLELGMGTSKLVEERTAATDGFYETISAEEGDQLADADILVTYGDDSTLAALQGDALLARIPAVEHGAVAVLQDSTPLAASANPSPLSIGWGLDDYLAILAAAADKS